jgi:hypothetical protein
MTSFDACVVAGVVSLIGLATLPSADALAQFNLNRPVGQVVIQEAAGVSQTNCELVDKQAGGFGAVRNMRSLALAGGRFTLPTGYDGKPATSLQAVLWCPGYAFVRIDQLDLRSTRQLTVALRPLASVPVSLRVLAPSSGGSVAGMRARVFYIAVWICHYLREQDCGVPSFRIAEPVIGNDGTVTFSVPDFQADPAITGFPGLASAPDYGSFQLDAVQDTPPYARYSLVPEDPRLKAMFGRLPAVSSYPDELVVRPVGE